MALKVMHFSVLILAITFVQSLYAVPLEPKEKNDLKSLVLKEVEFKPELQVMTEEAAPVRRARNTGVIFRPLFATRERDADREESRRRADEAKRARDQRKAAQKESARRRAAAAATAQQYQHSSRSMDRIPFQSHSYL